MKIFLTTFSTLNLRLLKDKILIIYKKINAGQKSILYRAFLIT